MFHPLNGRRDFDPLPSSFSYDNVTIRITDQLLLAMRERYKEGGLNKQQVLNEFGCAHFLCSEIDFE